MNMRSRRKKAELAKAAVVFWRSKWGYPLVVKISRLTCMTSFHGYEWPHLAYNPMNSFNEGSHKSHLFDEFQKKLWLKNWIFGLKNVPFMIPTHVWWVWIFFTLWIIESNLNQFFIKNCVWNEISRLICIQGHQPQTRQK